MKFIILFLLSFLALNAHAQITITPTDTSIRKGFNEWSEIDNNFAHYTFQFPVLDPKFIDLKIENMTCRLKKDSLYVFTNNARGGNPLPLGYLAVKKVQIGITVDKKVLKNYKSLKVIIKYEYDSELLKGRWIQDEACKNPLKNPDVLEFDGENLRAIRITDIDKSIEVWKRKTEGRFFYFINGTGNHLYIKELTHNELILLNYGDGWDIQSECRYYKTQ